MSKTHCADCGGAYDARAMQSCKQCGAYLCTDCAQRQGERCGECAG
ncbi:MAG: hypothetical protein LBU67_01885 [Oscillospiraceae bacterium]|nr:hypothetical protein [Oscillospiraceae bacterium]